jgi:hypothetical protein
VAIERALSTAEPGDVVVIAGKGHEQGQEFADGLKLPFDDVTVARELRGAAPRAVDEVLVEQALAQHGCARRSL